MDKTIKYTEEIKKQIEASAKELEKLINLFKELEKDVPKKEESKAGQILTNIEKKSANAIKAVNALAGSFEEIGKATGDEKFSRYAAEMKDAAQMIQSTIDGAKTGGGWGALIGLAIGIFKSVSTGIADQKKNEREWENQTLAFQHEYNKLLLQRNYLEKEFSTMFGKQNIERARGAYTSAQDSWNKYQEALNKELTGDTSYSKTQKDFLNPLGAVTEFVDDSLDSFGGVGKFFRNFGDQVSTFVADTVPILKWFGIGRTISNKNEVLRDAQERGMNSMQGMLIQTKKRRWYKIGSSDRYTTLYDLAPEMWNNSIDGEFDTEAAKKFLETNKKISDEQRQQIQQTIDLKDEYDKAMEVVDKQIEDTFGKLAGSITDGIFDSIRNGADAWEVFEKAGLDVIDNLGKQLVQEMLVSAFTEKYKERMRDAYKLGSNEETQNELANIMTDMSNEMPGMIQMATTAAQQWEQMARDNGWNMDKLKSKDVPVSFENLQTSLTDLIKKTDRAFDDIRESFESHMSDAILNTIKKKYLKENLEKWYAQ